MIKKIDPPVIVSNRGTFWVKDIKWLDGPIKYSIHNRAEFVILSAALHSDDSMQKKKQKKNKT